MYSVLPRPQQLFFVHSFTCLQVRTLFPVVPFHCISQTTLRPPSTSHRALVFFSFPTAHSKDFSMFCEHRSFPALLSGSPFPTPTILSATMLFFAVLWVPVPTPPLPPLTYVPIVFFCPNPPHRVVVEPPYASRSICLRSVQPSRFFMVEILALHTATFSFLRVRFVLM